MAGPSPLTEQRLAAEHIWRAAVQAVRPQDLVAKYFADAALAPLLAGARRLIVVGGGKAGAAMAEGVEQALALHLDRVSGWINVPAGAVRPLQAIHLHAARPDGHNHPTAEGVAGANQILRLVADAGPEDVVLCLLSGGGSALLPAPVYGIALEDKQQVTELLHACGASIDEMNAVRKHLSRIKGGRLAQAFHGKRLISLIISDVIADPPDVIASGPTAPDPTTFRDALSVLERYGLGGEVPPAAVLDHLRCGAAGLFISETLKHPQPGVDHVIVGNAETAHAAAIAKALELGYRVVDLGANVQGDTAAAVERLAAQLQQAENRGAGRRCYIAGGETTVRLGADHGLGGRNQQLVLGLALRLGLESLQHTVVFSAGTDGEDGPTDAAGAFADWQTLERAQTAGINPQEYLNRNDAYHFFEATGDLFKPGLTQTNVMDVCVVVYGPPQQN
jgi:hydroxypyruvate reductase/glycerate 2-kinase